MTDAPTGGGHAAGPPGGDHAAGPPGGDHAAGPPGGDHAAGPPGGDHAAVDPREQGRRFPQWPLSSVLLGVALGLVIALVDGWRLGAVVVGAAVLWGSGLRLVLPARALGLLAVRGRPVDVGLLVVAGVGIVALAILVPAPR